MMHERYAALLRHFHRYSNKGWHDAKPLPFFGDGSASEAGLRSCGSFVFTASLLAGPAGVAIGIAEDERRCLANRALLTIRYMTQSHLTGSGQCHTGGQWGLEWQSSWWAARMALGAALLGDMLDDAARRGVERVVTSEAGRQLDRTPPSGLVRDTKAEENAWDCEIIGAALALYPNDARAPLWREKLSEFAINTLSTADDRTDSRVIDGRAISEWNCSVNLHPGLQLENHGAYHFCYVASPLHSLTWTRYALMMGAQEPVEALDHNFKALWENCLHTFLDNRFAYISGQDWARYTYGTYFMQPVLALLHGRDGDARAQFVEERRLARLGEEQRTNDDGSFFGRRVTRGIMTGQSLKYETDCYANVALAYLLHTHYRPEVSPIEAKSFFGSIRRTNISHETLVASSRGQNCFASFSWSTLYSPEPLVLFAPNGCDDAVEWSPGNLVGRVRPLGAIGQPLYVQSMHETPSGFHVTGTQLLLGPGGQRLLERAIEVDADVILDRMEIRCRVRARRRGWIRLSEGLSLFVPNDIFNGNERTLHSDSGEIVLRKPTSRSAKTNRPSRLCNKLLREVGLNEKLRRCGEGWLNIDDRIGIILRKPASGFWVSEGPDNSGPDDLFCHRIVAPRTRRWFYAKSGETLLDTHVLIVSATAEDTRQLATKL